MKKAFITHIAAYSALFVLGALLLSCGDHSGLGSAVDTTAPIVTLTSHEDNDTVPAAFTLSGTAFDNDKVTNLTIDFSDADLHYQITPGGTWKKKTAATAEWTELSDGEGSCVSVNGTWNWSLYVDTSEKSSSWEDQTFELTLVAEDALGNSSKTSKIDRSLTVDGTNPDVTIYKPELFTGDYSAVLSAVGSSDSEGYQLNDGNVLSRLLNGDITISGRQENSVSFKELRIQFDNGALSSGKMKVTGSTLIASDSADEIAEAVDIGDDDNLEVYFSTILSGGDLRNWSVTIAESEWVNQDMNASLLTGKHLIRVVTTSVSSSGAWQKKVIGYFLWWREADTPWITTYIGSDADLGDSTYEVYPSSYFTGKAQDDDGIATLSYSVQKKGDDGAWSEYTAQTALALSESGTTYSAWSVRTPSENGLYRLTVTVIDVNGATASVTKYFKTLDVQPPKITVSSPESGSAILSDAVSDSSGNFTFSGVVSDDGTVTSLVVVHLNPALSDDIDNKIKYLSGTDSNFGNATESGFTDENGNKIYALSIGTPSYNADEGANEYAFARTFNLFSDLGIDGSTRLLEAQDFIFRAVDNGGTSSVLSFTLSGDTTSPSLTLDSITLYNAAGTVQYSKTFGSETPTLPQIQNGDYAVISGTWSDNSTAKWGDVSKIGDIALSWLEADATVTKNTDGTWSARITSVPTSSGAVSVSLTDWGGNKKTVTSSVFVETAAAALELISSSAEDGSYTVGATITINLEFNKYILFTGSNPSLKLNNGGTATCTTAQDTATVSVSFLYTVELGQDVSNLGVSEIIQDGVTWSDNATKTSFTCILPTASTKKLETTRNICIDTVSPTVQSLSAITANGSYTTGSQINLMLTFSENANIADASALSLTFAHGATTGTAIAVGAQRVLFQYEVASGENANPLTVTALTAPGVTDEAGNALTDFSLPTHEFTNRIIDTTAPSAPVVGGITDGDLVLDSSGTSFTVTGESGATIEYSIDGGGNYQTYTGAVSLKNNGIYYITAKQTDKAGNESPASAVKTVTVDKGALLQRITATTVNGTYSTNTTTTSISGLIEFRAPVTIAKGAAVTLNVTNGSQTSKTVDITECKNGDSSNAQFTFSYDIVSGDITDGYLDVTGWSFPRVTYNGKTVEMSVPETGEGKRFNENREIKIITGVPTIKSVDLSGTGENAVLTIGFDREISKNSGSIVFTQNLTESPYRAPAVLTASEYNTIPSAAQSSYSKGTNGATLNSDSTLTNDTSTKYVLDYDTDIDDATFVGYFTAANMHVVSVPVVSSAVSVSGSTLTVTLGSTYKLPTMGAQYTLSIPAWLVVDAVNNPNTDDNSRTVTAQGVEAPEIRIQKESQKITISDANAPTTTASVTTPATASMKISCRTPGATIYYAKTSDDKATSKTITIETDLTVEKQTAKPKISDLPASDYSSSTDVIVTDMLGTAISGYDSATGMKYAIAAYAMASTGTSEMSYEYATRSVLKLEIRAYGNWNYCEYNEYSAVSENNTTLTYGKLKIWIQGGDAAYGGNSLDPFPLSWGDSKNFKMMEGSHDTVAMTGKYYWVTWDLSATAYHGFAIGDVHDFGNGKIGPSTWYTTDCGWTKYKTSYPLYPGETLEMVTSEYGGSTFQFNKSLKSTEPVSKVKK